jgi:hypothetical protein
MNKIRILLKSYVSNCTKTGACRGKRISDLDSALKKLLESVKISHATENENFFVALCNVLV